MPFKLRKMQLSPASFHQLIQSPSALKLNLQSIQLPTIWSKVIHCLTLEIYFFLFLRFSHCRLCRHRWKGAGIGTSVGHWRLRCRTCKSSFARTHRTRSFRQWEENVLQSIRLRRHFRQHGTNIWVELHCRDWRKAKLRSDKRSSTQWCRLWQRSWNCNQKNHYRRQRKTSQKFGCRRKQRRKLGCRHLRLDYTHYWTTHRHLFLILKSFSTPIRRSRNFNWWETRLLLPLNWLSPFPLWFKDDISTLRGCHSVNQNLYRFIFVRFIFVNKFLFLFFVLFWIWGD